MAEALINQFRSDHYHAVSAGSSPTGFVHPKAVETLQRHGIEAGHYESKSWDVFAGQSFDYVITVCDAAANEICPVFPGAYVKLHWSLVDPARILGAEADVNAAFEAAYMILKEKIQETFT
ncbi:Arsenate reductase [Methylophaga frappieri]|uniref:Arsenate reductase n=2 Tax=Methylophaga frappieri (strain ATCC BAA-2434 / DSM 25690 / JAM7) TaxID=754477 RepID=I1YFY5_METFJ|nr:Arsenate reductase [Methylophaga frappieri]